MSRGTAHPSAGARRRRRPDPFARADAEKASAESGASERPCDHKDCAAAGTHRAPVAPDRLDQHYWFCLDHVRDYNRAWNFCAGRSDHEIEAMIREDVVGWRPTWPLGRLGGRFAHSRFDRMKDGFGLFDDEKEAEAQARRAAEERARRRRNGRNSGRPIEEREALDVMELGQPLTLPALKARYKELVKRHHPDANGGDKTAEERLKLINHAYATLKQSLGA